MATEIKERFDFKCKECDYNANGKQSLTTHIKVHHLKQKILTKQHFRRFNCDKCEFFSSRKDGLEAHKEGAHSNIKLKCNLCRYETKWKKALVEHNRAHQNTLDKKYFKCSLCEYKSVYKCSLKSHMETHNTEKYECKRCGAMLNTKSILKLHVRSIHEGIKYDCNVGDKSFTQQDQKSIDAILST